MKNSPSPSGLIPHALAVVACSMGLAFMLGVTGLVAMAHYLGHTLAFIALGTHRGKLSDDSFFGAFLSWLTPDVELAQTYSAALTAMLFVALFLAARIGYRGLRDEASESSTDDRPWFHLSPRLFVFFLLMIAVSCGLLALDYNLYLFRSVTDALIESLKGKYIAGTLLRWGIVTEKHGDLYAIDAVRLFALGSLAITVGAAFALEFAATRTRESFNRFLEAATLPSERPGDTLDYDALVQVTGSDPEEWISAHDALAQPEIYAVDDCGNIYTRTLYERLAREETEPVGNLLNGTSKAFIIAVGVGMSLFSGSSARAMSHTPIVRVAFIVDPTGSFPHRENAEKLTVDAIRSLAPESTDPRRPPTPTVHWSIVSLDSYPRVIASGSEQDIERISTGDFFRRIFEDRKPLANCTAVEDAFRVAVEAVGPPDICANRIIYAMSDLKSESPSPAAKKPTACKPASFVPPNGMPWEQLSGIAVKTFFTPPGAIAAWTPVVLEHNLTNFVMYTGSGPEGRLPRPLPNPRCAPDADLPMWLLGRVGVVIGAFIGSLAFILGGAVALVRRKQKPAPRPVPNLRPTLKGGKGRKLP